MEVETEAEAVKKSIRSGRESNKNLLLPSLPLPWNLRRGFFLLEISLEIEPDLTYVVEAKAAILPSGSRLILKQWKRKQKQVDFKVVVAKAKAEAAYLKKLEEKALHVEAEAEAVIKLTASTSLPQRQHGGPLGELG